MSEFFRWAFVRCWPLSDTCSVNWDAWAAVGTVAAVFAAVFAPSIQRALVRSKANAVFALAFRGDLLAAQIRLNSLRDDYPMRDTAGAAWAVEQLLAENASKRGDFMARANYLKVLTQREVDLTRWPAVDVGLAAKVALAIESVRHFQIGADLLENPNEDRDWELFLKHMAEVLDRAIADVGAADDAIVEALTPLRNEQRKREKQTKRHRATG